MNKTILLTFCLASGSALHTAHAMDLKQSKITQVVNEVQIISSSDQSTKTATVNDVFNMPDILRTGPASRAELIAKDETVTRVGANTIFSFDPASRTIDLKQGSLLFHSPHGKGGGTIHTGSATASVLGTTLIVTTTPSGGMKVLDLEGSVEVKFLSGLKQNLAPGQMTFVLPGGSQLAPIIVYRLDDLTKNSQLVKGFNQPLSSMHLIESQINKQLNLIKDGHYTDTGLLVGNDANGSQVQVTVDVTTLQNALDNSGLNSRAVTRALATDATINQPSLTDRSIPSPPTHVFSKQFILPHNTFFTGQPFEGFAARNIFINTAGTEAPTLSVDLSPYSTIREFDMVAANNINIEGSVNFTGFSPVDSIFFFLAAGNQILISQNATLEADLVNLEMKSAGAFTLNNAHIVNNVGNTAMDFGSDVTLENGDTINTVGNLFIQTAGNFSATGSALDADSLDLEAPNGTLTVDTSALICNTRAFFQAAGDINVSSSVINADPASGQVKFTSASGSVNLNNNSIQTFNLTVNSGDGILLSGTGQSYSSSGGTANLTALNTATVQDADLSGFANLKIAATTIVLHNDNFSGTVELDSQNGQWHNGYSFGDVCDMGGNKYDGTSVSAADGFSGTIAGTGITIGTRH
jgi:hypothetical protein